MAIDIRTPYSSEVRLRLELGNVQLRLRDILGDTATVASPIDIPPHTLATLIIAIDGLERREEVILYDGMSASSKHVRFGYRSDREEPATLISEYDQ